MKRILLVSLFGLLLLAGLALAQEPKRKGSNLRRARDDARQLAADLSAARKLLGQVRDRALRERLELLITRSELRARELASYLGKVEKGGKKRALNESEFAKVLKTLKSKSFDDDKLAYLRSVAKLARFSCGQAKQLVDPFSFDKDGIKACVLLYPRLVDPLHFSEVLSVLTFESSRKKVMAELGL